MEEVFQIREKMSSAIDGILKEAKSGSELSKKADEAVKEMYKSPVPTTEDAIKQGFVDLVNNPPPPDGKKTKASKKPGKKPSTPKRDPEVGQEAALRLHTSLETKGATPTEMSALRLVRQRILAYWKQFHRKLRSEGFLEELPDLGMMNFTQLEELERQFVYFINRVPESEFVKYGFVAAAGAIEEYGPAMAKRLRFLPGSKTLDYQQGLGEVVKEAVEIPGEDGLQDEVEKIAIPFTGIGFSSPWFGLVTKLGRLLSMNAERNMHLIAQTQYGDGI